MDGLKDKQINGRQADGWMDGWIVLIKPSLGTVLTVLKLNCYFFTISVILKASPFRKHLNAITKDTLE